MKRAIELDPNFAIAYEGLAIEYGNMGRASLAAENGKRAYDLRDRVSEREKYRITAYYLNDVEGDIETGESDLRAKGDSSIKEPHRRSKTV